MTCSITKKKPSCGVWSTSKRLVAVITDHYEHPPIWIAHSEHAYARFVTSLVSRNIETVIMTDECALMHCLSQHVMARGLRSVAIPAAFIDGICSLAAWKQCTPKRKAAILARMPYTTYMMHLILRENFPQQLLLDM